MDITNNTSKRQEMRSKINFGELFFVLICFQLVILIVCPILNLFLDLCLITFNLTNQFRLSLVALAISNAIILCLIINSSHETKYRYALVIFFLFVILFSYSSFCLNVKATDDIKAAYIESPFENSNYSFNKSSDQTKVLNCCGLDYHEFYENGTFYLGLPVDFEMLPDACCSESIEIQNISYSGAACDIAKLTYYVRKKLATQVKNYYIMRSICYYYNSLTWFTSFISVILDLNKFLSSDLS